MTAKATIIDDSARPIPPRYWWTRRLGVLFGAYLLLLLALNAGANWYFGRLIDQRVQALQARGEPILVDDFQSSALPDQENAATLYQQAGPIIREYLPSPPAPAPETGDEQANAGEPVDETEVAPEVELPAYRPASLSDFCGWRDLVHARPDEIDQLLTLNAAALTLLDQAAARPRCDWGIRFSTPVLNGPLAPTTGVRNVSRLQCARALRAAEAGDHALALKSISGSLHLTDSFGDGPATFLMAMIALAGDFQTCSAIEQVAPDLQVGDAAPDATRADVMALIKCLLDERARCGSIRAGLFAERCMQLDAINCLLNGKLAFTGLAGGGGGLGDDAIRLVASPLWRSEAVKILDYSSKTAQAAEAATWPAAKSQLPDERFDDVDDLPFSLLDMLAPSFHRIIERHFQALAQRRMAATALAIRLYQLDRDARPSKLADLVPNYLPAVPADPFSPEGGALKYCPDADPPVLYCIGADGRDDGGRYERPDPGFAQRPTDVLFFLDGPPPREDLRLFIESPRRP